jgi:hypothetical protein
MCIEFFKNLFKPKPPPVYEPASKIFLTLAIDDYPGYINDLDQCLNDQDRLISVLPGFQVRRFTDKDVTTRLMREQLTKIVAEAKAGDVIMFHYSGHGTQVRNNSEEDGYNEAFYLQDDRFLDDEFHEILAGIPDSVTFVCLIDSCFSGGMSRNPRKSRFVQTEDKILTKRVSKFVRSDLKCIIMAACQENQTAADGAFSPCAALNISKLLTYRQWYYNIKYCLNYNNFTQVPTLEGPDELLNTNVKL